MNIILKNNLKKIIVGTIIFIILLLSIIYIINNSQNNTKNIAKSLPLTESNTDLLFLVDNCKATFDIDYNCNDIESEEYKKQCKSSKTFSFLLNTNDKSEQDLKDILNKGDILFINKTDKETTMSFFTLFNNAITNKNINKCYEINDSILQNICTTIISNKEDICNLFFGEKTLFGNYEDNSYQKSLVIKKEICQNFIFGKGISTKKCEKIIIN